ncbi:RNA polymerase sigma factor [Micrococcus luteus]|uniref:RNA polymerase sigma factor n=1 Tax=Micrococcus luteus TaxID=1270 RepID=UPI0037C8166C
MTGDELAEAVASVRGTVVAVLGPSGNGDVVEDVLQSTWESAWHSRERFDPDRGSLRTWVGTIARNRAVDHLRAVGRSRAGQEALEASAVAREKTAVSTVMEDPAEAVVEALAAHREVAEVMRVVESVMESSEMTARALAVVLAFGDDVVAASEAMGVSVTALRQARRELVRCARVVRAAQEVARSGQAVTMRVLISCLPDDGDAGDWARQVALACAQAGGRMEAVSVEDVMQATGFSHSTSRQYLAETRHLLRVATTVIRNERAEK